VAREDYPLDSRFVYAYGKTTIVELENTDEVPDLEAAFRRRDDGPESAPSLRVEIGRHSSKQSPGSADATGAESDMAADWLAGHPLPDYGPPVAAVTADRAHRRQSVLRCPAPDRLAAQLR
jgi:hypothetical protein